MKTYLRRAILTVFASTVAAAAHGQFYRLHQADAGVAIAGQYTTSITDQTVSSVNGDTLPHQSTTDSPSVLVTFRDHPFSWFGAEFNYQYTQLSENYFIVAPSPNLKGAANTEVHVPTNFHEATGAYLLHLKTRRGFQPFVGVGGGGIDFVPTFAHEPNQWRLTGLFDIGADYQTKSRLGFKVGARGLFYRAPNFYNPVLSSSRWVATSEPYAGVYVRF